MIAYAILFALTVFAGAMVLLAKDTVKSAMALVMVMICLAANFLLMGQEFVAFIQIIVYAGAIMVVFLFVIMLLNLREVEKAPWYLARWRGYGGSLALLFFFLLAWGIQTFQTTEVIRRPADAAAASIPALSTAMLTQWVLPFVLTSVLLLVAVIGAVVMARRTDDDGKEIVVDED